MEVMGYDINFFPEPEYFASLETDADYVNYRATATHDLHHILSGFSLNNFGELGVMQQRGPVLPSRLSLPESDVAAAGLAAK